MNTFLQMLRIAFWMSPLQRVLTIVGVFMLVAGVVRPLPFNMPGSTLPAMFLGVALIVVVPLLAGGVFLRMLSSSRALLLRPHARGRLLGSSFGIMLLATGAWIFCYWIAFLPAPLKYKPDAEAYLLMFTTTMAFGTQCAVALFIAARSPFWTLGILVIWQAPGLLLHALGVEDASRLLGGPVSLAMSALGWVIFGIWFLRARQIHGSAWGRRDKGGAATAATASVVRPASREEAMSRWVLANATPLQLGLQCLLASAAVLAIQWFFARDAGVKPLQSMMFGALALVSVVTGAVGSSMAARSRLLWLAGGRTREELFRWVERQLLRVMLAVLLAIIIAASLAWNFISPRPLLPASYVAAALLAPGLCAAWLGVMQQHRRGLVDVLAALLIAAGIFYGLVLPLYEGIAARWYILGGELALAIALRELARMRWRSADWRRAA